MSVKENDAIAQEVHHSCSWCFFVGLCSSPHTISLQFLPENNGQQDSKGAASKKKTPNPLTARSSTLATLNATARQDLLTTQMSITIVPRLIQSAGLTLSTCRGPGAIANCFIPSWHTRQLAAPLAHLLPLPSAAQNGASEIKEIKLTNYYVKKDF